MNITTNYFSTNTSCKSLFSVQNEICNVLLRDCAAFQIKIHYEKTLLETSENPYLTRVVPFLLTNRFLAHKGGYNCQKATIVNDSCQNLTISFWYRFNEANHRYVFEFRANEISQDEVALSLPCEIADGCCQRKPLEMTTISKGSNRQGVSSLHTLFFCLVAKILNITNRKMFWFSN